jgi:hypothetical protein
LGVNSLSTEKGFAARLQSVPLWEHRAHRGVWLDKVASDRLQEGEMGFGRGALLWLLGVPLPIIILIVLFWHH